MARKKEAPKPLLNVKHDFVDALDNFIGKLSILVQAIETAISLDQIGGAAKPIVREALDEFRAALYGRD